MLPAAGCSLASLSYLTAGGADTGTPDGSAGDSSGSGFCAREHHDLCQDFDDGRFDGWLAAGGGKVHVDPDASVSPPDSLVVVLPSGAQLSATIEAALPRSTSRVVCGFALRIDAIDDVSDKNVAIFSISTKGGPTNYSLTYNLDGWNKTALFTESTSSPDGGSSSVVGTRNPMPSLGTWQVVKVDATLVPGAGSASLSVGEQSFGPFALSSPGGAFGHVSLGAEAELPLDSPVEIRFDDVACDPSAP
jgi:hypothetical protein